MHPGVFLCPVRARPGAGRTSIGILGGLLTWAVTLSPICLSGQTAVEAWSRRYSNITRSDDRATRVVTDSTGNVIVAGTTDGGVTSRDMLVIKYSSAGVAMWTNRYDGPGHGEESAGGLAVDGSGTVYVTGLSIGLGTGADYVTIAYSSAGVALWTNRYNGPGNGADGPNGLAVGGGNVYVTGYSEGGGGNFDYLTIAYSTSGAMSWVRRYDGTGSDYDEATGVAVDGAGNVYVTGYSTGLGTSGDYATIGYTSAGTGLWTNRYNGPGNGEEYPSAVVAVGTNVYVTGSSDGGGGNDDFATVAYSSAGTTLWVGRYNGPGNDDDGAAALTADGNANVYVTGYSATSGSRDYATIAYSSGGAALWTNRYNGPASRDDQATGAAVANGVVYITGHSNDGASHPDYATVAYSTAGTALWTNRFDGPVNRDDTARAVAVDSSGRAFVTGDSLSAQSFDWATVAYASGGTVDWVVRYDGMGNDQDQPQAVAVGTNGNVYVTGSSVGSGQYNFDYATVAYSSTGAPLWTNRYEGSGGSDGAVDIAVEGANVFVTGNSFEPSTAADYVTIAYSSTGATLWAERYDGPANGYDNAVAVAVAGGTNVVVTGTSEGTNSATDFATIAYSTAGVALWTNRYDGPVNEYDQATALAVGGNGQIYVTGYSAGGSSGDDYATIFYSSTGIGLKTNRYNGPGDAGDYPTALTVGPNGNVYVTGYSAGTSSGDDYATVAYSSAGAALWTNRFNGLGNGDDHATGVAVGTNGNVYVTGYTLGGGTGDECATIAYTSTGVALWTNRYNGHANNGANAVAVAVDVSGRVYVTGASYDLGGGSDFATIAYSSSGSALWTNLYHGPFSANQPSTARSIAVAGDGSVVVIGQSAGGYTGYYDYATVKYVTGFQLAINRTSTNTVMVSWPSASPGFNLQQNSNLNTLNWVTPSETVVSNGATKFIIVNPPTGSRFYRLLKP